MAAPEPLAFSLAFPQGAQTLQSDVAVHALAPGVWQHVTYGEVPQWGMVAANGLVIVDGGEAILVDTGWSETQTSALLDWVETQLGARTVALVVTHAHDDRIAGIAEAHRRDIPSYSSALTAEFAAEAGWQVPTHTFTETVSLSVGELDIELRYPGGGHARDNSVVWVPSAKALYGGCLVRSTGSTSRGNVADADLEAWPGSIQVLLKAYPEVNIVLPGHGKPGGRELLEHTLRLVSPLRGE